MTFSYSTYIKYPNSDCKADSVLFALVASRRPKSSTAFRDSDSSTPTRLQQSVQNFDLPLLRHLSQYLHLTASTMTSSATTYSTLGDPKHGGALFTLPREVRDEIYRFVVRNRYVIYITRPGSGDPLPSKGKHEFAVLQVSKAINHEVSDILYAESVFRFSMTFGTYKVFSVPGHLASRMTNAEIDFQGLTYCASLYSYAGSHKNTNAICDAATAGLASTDIKRNHLHIRFFNCCPGMIMILSSSLSKTLNAFIGFRTVLIEVVSVCVTYLEIARSTGNPKPIGVLQKDITMVMGQQILDLLTPTLGPAKTAVPGHVNSYILHPQDYLASSAR